LVSVPDFIFRVVLPLYGVLAFVGVWRCRSVVRRQTGHDPIVIAPLGKTRSAATRVEAWLELVFLLCASVAAADIGLNALAPDAVGRRLAVPLLRDFAPIGWTGLFLMTAGLVVCSVAMRDMGMSWRMGVDREHPGVLVTRGIYGRIRHPIYTGIMLVVCGAAAITADVLSIAVAAAALVGLPVQARLEEEFLAGRHGNMYAEYRQKTRRF
jgi:protein-S-isoprenylcysteine O-methyltransferase Ste14